MIGFVAPVGAADGIGANDHVYEPKRKTFGIIAPEVRDGKTNERKSAALGQECTMTNGNNALAVDAWFQLVLELVSMNQQG